MTNPPTRPEIAAPVAAPARRRGTKWTVIAVIEVVVAAAAVVADVAVPTFVILAIATASLMMRKERLATLGFWRPPQVGRMAGEVFLLVVGWTALQLAVIMPVLNHLTGDKQDLGDFADLQHNVGLLTVLLLLTWTIVAPGEEARTEASYNGESRDVVGSGRIGILVAVGLSSLLFGLAHTEQGVIGVAVTFLDAVFFSALKFRYKDNLWASVLAHGFNNTIGLGAFFLVGPVYGLW